MKKPTIENRLAAIELMVREIHTVLTPARRIRGVDEGQYRKAIDALLAGDTIPLSEYMIRGGEIPGCGTNDRKEADHA